MTGRLAIHDYQHEPSTDTISGTVWYDPNGNGQFYDDGKAAGIAGVVVTFRDRETMKLVDTVTDSNGHYVFAGLNSESLHIVKVRLDQAGVFTLVSSQVDFVDGYYINPEATYVKFDTTPGINEVVNFGFMPESMLDGTRTAGDLGFDQKPSTEEDLISLLEQDLGYILSGVINDRFKEQNHCLQDQSVWVTISLKPVTPSETICAGYN